MDISFCSKKTNFAVLGFLIFYLCESLWNKLGFFLSLNHEEIYENWMINYRGGFLRRGLGGEIILHLASLFGVSHIVVVNILTFVIWVILISFFITKFVQKQYPLFILAMPFCLGETIFADPSYFLRKDSLSILIFILMLTLFFKKKSLPHSLLFLFLNSLFILGILIHEEIFFFSFPILFISYWHRNKSFCKTLLFFTPPAAAFIYCCMNIQDQQIVTEMLARTPEIKNPASNALLYIPLSEYFSRVWTMVNDPSLLATGLYFILCRHISFDSILTSAQIYGILHKVYYYFVIKGF